MDAISGSVTLDDAQVTANKSAPVVGGGAVYTMAADITVRHSTIADNVGQGGAGIFFWPYIAPEKRLIVADSVISGNRPVDPDGNDGGGIYVGPGGVASLSGVTFVDNVPQSLDGQVTVVNSTFSGPTGSGFGALFIAGGTGTVTVRHSTFAVEGRRSPRAPRPAAPGSAA